MKVSIGIPFCNNASTLVNAIRSVFAQTYTDWELILVSDGLADRSLEIARAVDDPRVRVFYDGINRGLSYRLNQIAQYASGQYLFRMDADDMMFPDRVKQQMSFLEKHPDIDVIGAKMCTIDRDCHPIGIRGREVLNKQSRSVLRRGLFIHVSVAGKRDWFRQNPYDGFFLRAQDHELWCRTHRDSRFAFIPEPLMFVSEVESFQLYKYFQSSRIERKIFRTYGPVLVGRPYTGFLLLESYLKSAVYILFYMLHISDFLIRRRNVPIEQKQYLELRRTIKYIMQTSVPGLSISGRENKMISSI